MSLRQLTLAMGGDVTVLAVNVAEVPVRVRKFISETPVPFPVLLDGDRAAAKAWGITTLPASYVLDQARSPRLMAEGNIDWMSAGVRLTLSKIAAGEPR